MDNPEEAQQLRPPFKDWTVEHFQSVREEYNKRLNDLVAEFKKESGAEIVSIDVGDGTTRWKIGIYKYI